MIKGVVTTLALFIFSFSVLGQHKDKSDTLTSRLQGSWQWMSEDSELFTVKLLCTDTTVHAKVGTNYFRYKIYGWHKISKKGVELENTTQNFGDINTISIFGTIINDSQIKLNFHDLTRDRNFRVYLEFLDPEMKTLKWTSSPQERPLYPAPKAKIWEGQTVPSNIILHRVSD
jgi:hypothetical protein